MNDRLSISAYLMGQFDRTDAVCDGDLKMITEDCLRWADALIKAEKDTGEGE